MPPTLSMIWWVVKLYLPIQKTQKLIIISVFNFAPNLLGNFFLIPSTKTMRPHLSLGEWVWILTVGIILLLFHIDFFQTIIMEQRSCALPPKRLVARSHQLSQWYVISSIEKKANKKQNSTFEGTHKRPRTYMGGCVTTRALLWMRAVGRRSAKT